MNQTAVLHKGLLLDCKVCNPPTETQEKRERRKRRGPVSLDMVIRRQVAADLGEDEPQKDERFQLLQKYGVAAPRIDRLVIKPNWMGVVEWKRKQNEWYKATKGMVAPQQRREGRYASQAKFNTLQNRGVPRSFREQRNVSASLQTRVESDSQRSGFQRQQKTFGPIRNNSGRQAGTSQGTGREVRGMSKENRSFGDRP